MGTCRTRKLQLCVWTNNLLYSDAEILSKNRCFPISWWLINRLQFLNGLAWFVGNELAGWFKKSIYWQTDVLLGSYRLLICYHYYFKLTYFNLYRTLSRERALWRVAMKLLQCFSEEQLFSIRIWTILLNWHMNKYPCASHGFVKEFM